ncbi:MAG: hypothetical protein WA865_04175 [Spirulinaceae cyanobacterium]
MNCDRKELDLSHLPKQQQEIVDLTWALARQHQEDSYNLLSLLRTLELLHREIREELFQPSLPDNRQKLYNLVKDIEETGGWPYIERMRLNALLNNWLEALAREQEKKV